MRALIPICVIASPVVPPALDSFTPPVSGDLPPIEMRSHEEMRCPTISPGAKMSLFFAPSGSQVAGTSSTRMRASKPRPPRCCHVSGVGCIVRTWVRVLIRHIFINSAPNLHTCSLANFISHAARFQKLLMPRQSARR